MLRHLLRFGKLAVGIVPLIIAASFLLALFLPLASQAQEPHADPAELPWSAPPSFSESISRLTSSWAYHQWDWRSLDDEEGFVDVILYDPRGSPDRLYVEQYIKSDFSAVFPGYLAHMPVETLEIMLSIDGEVMAYPDLPVHAMLTDAIPQIGADQIWPRFDSNGDSVTGKGIVAAVIDTGVYYNHPDLGGGFGPSYKVIGGYDFYNDDSDPNDDNGHGTHVAGIIAANGGIKGVAPDAKILAYKVLGPDGFGSMGAVISAIDRAIDPNNDGDTSDHADIISMSLGGPGEIGDPITLAVARAVAEEVVVVVAAGNDGPTFGTVASPGIAPEAITVGAIDDSSILAAFSSRGTSPELNIKPELSAPGVGIVSTVPTEGCMMSSPTGYLPASGTSMATPFVSGAAALLLQLHPDWTPQMVKSALITGAKRMNDSIWRAGAGALWLPDSADSYLLFDDPLISYGMAGDDSVSLFVVNDATSSATLSFAASDYYVLSADGATLSTVWVNKSSVAPSSVSIPAYGTESVTMYVSSASSTSPEGYYEGRITVTHGSVQVSVPFGYAILSRVNIHVMNTAGQEIYDPYGGVWIYDVPNATLAIGRRGDIEPSPPASFLVPSGDYNIHAMGHQLLYSYSDPYIMSARITLSKSDVKDVYLNLSDAKRLNLILETDEGNPIYVKDYRAYCRYEGTRNISFHLVGSDYSVKGAEIFSLPKSMTIYVSETDARVGISIAGFSYSSGMWEFMRKNWQHWFEYSSDTSTAFYLEASTDLQYLLAWEFDGIDSSTSSLLALEQGQCSVYETKYDIPGEVREIWGDWGIHRSIGGDATFFVRRDTDTSLNAFFSGITRKTFVQGVFTEVYFPTSLFNGYFEMQYYVPDYSRLVRASTMSEIYLPDRNFLMPIAGINRTMTVGSGPFYPAVRVEVTDSSMVLYQPLLRDRSGARVSGTSTPMMELNRNGNLIGIYMLSEHLARPDAKRIVELSGSGSYVSKITYTPSPQICSSTMIELGFVVPMADMNPPTITGLRMPAKYLPSKSLNISVGADDESSAVIVEINWRQTGEPSWRALNVSSTVSGEFYGSIPSMPDVSSIDLRIRVTDASGNYLDYIALNAAKKQIPVVFDLSVDNTTIEYTTRDQSVIITGHLSNLGGSPLSAAGGIPIELMAGGKKMAMILDEYNDGTSHSHNGTIRFEWRFNPTKLFTGPNETLEIVAEFDLGIYEAKTAGFVLHSVPSHESPPEINAPIITLVSPANNSLIPRGLSINLNISDDGTFIAEYSVDEGPLNALGFPYDVPTSLWADGNHVLRILVTDVDSLTSTASFNFETDGTPPSITVISDQYGNLTEPFDVIAEVADAHGIYSVLLFVEFTPGLYATMPMAVSGSLYEATIQPSQLWDGMKIYVRAIDMVGNIAQTPEIVLYLNATNPDDSDEGTTNQTDVPTNDSSTDNDNHSIADNNTAPGIPENNSEYDRDDNRTLAAGSWLQNMILISIVAISPALIAAAFWRRKHKEPVAPKGPPRKLTKTGESYVPPAPSKKEPPKPVFIRPANIPSKNPDAPSTLKTNKSEAMNGVVPEQLLRQDLSGPKIVRAPAPPAPTIPSKLTVKVEPKPIWARPAAIEAEEEDEDADIRFDHIDGVPEPLRVHYAEGFRAKFQVVRSEESDIDPNLGPKIVRGLELKKQLK